MEKIIFVLLHLLFYVNARPFKNPDFVSQWFYLQSIPGRERIDVFHHLGEVPDLVQVQVRSNSINNPGFIFPAIGIVPRDDDEIEPRSGIVYLYNEKMVMISAQSINNHYQGRTIYTENSNYWEGPNNDDSFDCYVRVRAWKTSSMPVPDFQMKNIKIHAACEKGTDCFYEIYHGLKEYPSMVIVRTKLLDVSSEFHGFISDAVGSGMMVYENDPIKRNGYVTYGFDSERFRIWTDSSEYGCVFYGEDGPRITGNFRSGELEILAWRSSSLTPTIKETIQLGVSPGVAFDKDKSIPDLSTTEDIIVNLWAEATNGSNVGYRFTGSGALAYTTYPTTFPCSYGGLTYAYTNATIRIWKPGAANIGAIICIPRTFGGGMHTQGSNLAYAKAHIWIPRGVKCRLATVKVAPYFTSVSGPSGPKTLCVEISTLNMNCSKPEDCFDIHSFCNNMTCMCHEGYYETDFACEKNLTCTDAVPLLPDLQRRARNYVINGSSFSDEYVDDTGLKLSWYLTKDYQMPDVSTLPERNSCGTKYPVYVNGTHPTLNQIGETPIQLNVCYDDCKQTTTIMVRKCAGTMHYQLTRIPVKENAYCFDPPELQNITEFEPVPEVEDFTLNVSVELHFQITYLNEPNKLVTSYDPYLTFNCTIDRYLSKQLFYTTYWYIGSKLFIALGPSNEVQNLTEQMLNDRKQKLNVHISCGIKISSTETGLMTKLTKSDEKFFGIKVKNPVINLKKGEDSYVELEPTAPIGCRYSDRDGVPKTCNHSVYLVHPETEGCDLNDIINIQKVKRCGSFLKAHTFNETWESGVVDKFQITTVDKNFADGHQFRLPFQLDNHYHKIWNEHLIDEVMVFVTHNNDYKFKQCYSHVDPHMQTADGYKYENQNEGEFVLYRNIKYGIEVQEKTTPCNKGRAYCACAVAVRAGGDIFLINTCGGLKFIGFTSCNDGGILDIKKRTSLRYQVFTPIGTYIDIQMRPHPSYYDLMNIDVYMAAKDINQTEGLCGFFDNNHNNDLRKRDRHSFIPTKNSKRNSHKDFSQEWRLQPFEHNYLVLSPDNVQSWQAEQRDMFCYCNKSLHNNSDADSSRESSAVCSASIYGNCTQSKYKHTHDLCENTNRRFRRSLPGFIREREMKRRQQLVNKGRKNVSKRNAINQEKITEEYAEKHCSDIITSQISVKQFSHRLKSIDPQQLITDCVYDIMEDNDLSWADVYPGVLNQVIEVYNDRDPEYVKANKEEVAEFTSQSCPLNCSGRGICSTDGDCLCTVGYHGSDCGIREDDLINIDDIEGGGVCDVIYGDECQCFHIQTINLLEDFRCQISEISVMVNSSQKLVSIMQSPGNYDDIFNGECCVPLSRTKRSEDANDIFATELEFSISNNGRDFGMATKIYILDSTCQELIIVDNGTFVALKEQTCFISGICRIQNETRFGDECSVCLSEHNKFDWTETCEAPRKFEGLTLQFILGLCGGLSVALVCIILFCILKKYRGKYKISVAEYIIYKTEPPKEMDYRYPRPNLNIFRVKNSE